MQNPECRVQKLLLLAAFFVVLTCGCMVQPPGGEPIQTVMLGSTLDEANRQQEENAEAAKFVVYAHEFEINVPLTQPDRPDVAADGFVFTAPERVRGFRLTPYGQDHVYQIAQQIAMEQQSGAAWPMWDVVIERSETSKVWDTRHRYPVHFNPELDEARRQTVVTALESFGVAGADDLVLVAPAFSEGLDANEAAAAYSSSRQSGNQGGGFGRGNGGGFGF